HLVGIGEFFSPKQNTVFLRVRLPNDDVIWKPHYPNSPAHMTLYDGKDKHLAHLLYEKLKPIFDFEASLRTSGMLKLQDELPLLPYNQLLRSLFADFTHLGDEPVELWSQNLDAEQRVELASVAARHLKNLFYEHDRVTSLQSVDRV